MKIDKSLLSGSTTMLILKLIEKKDMYGYQMIDELSKQSNNIFELKAGTLYPLLHNLEKRQMVHSYEVKADSSKVRKYYSITKKGRGLLKEKHNEWSKYTNTVKKILEGGTICEPA